MLALVAMAQAYVLAPGSRYAAANRRIYVSAEPPVPLVAMQMPDERDYLYRDPPAQAEWQPEYTEQQYYRDAQPPAEWQPENTEQQYYAPPPAEAQPEFVEEQYYRDAPPPAEWQPEYTEQQYYRGPPPPAEVQFAEQPYYQDAPPPTGVESRDAPAPAEVKLDFTEQQLEALERAQDPFRAIRKVVYGLFGVVSVAGVGVSAMQMGDNAGQSLQNLVINIALGAAVFAAFNFDTTVVQKEIKNKTRKDLQNPYLKGDSEFFFEKKGDK